MRPFGDYFQWNVRTYFQKICSWTRYRNAKLIKNMSNFLVALVRFFALEKQPKNLHFHSAFTSKRPFGGYFQWKACTYFQEICSWTRHSDGKLSKNMWSFWSNSSTFALEKQPENINFHSGFTSKRAFGGYFQWNASTYFQKMCRWTGYSDAKLMKTMSNFLVPLLRFCSTKAT